MPTPYLEKLHKEQNIPMAKLEEYWSRAKDIAKKRDPKDYALVTTIFKRIVGVSSESQSDSRHVPEWWSLLDTKQQKDYIRDHPGSKLSPMRNNPNDALRAHTPTYRDKPAARVPVAKERPSTPTTKRPVGPMRNKTRQVDDEDLDDDLGDTPKRGGSDLSILGEKNKNLKHIVKRKYLRRRAGIAHTVRHHKRGLGAIKALFSGKNVNSRDYEQAKSTAALCGKLVLGALVGVAAFALLGPLVLPMAQVFLSDSVGESLSSESSNSSDEDFAAEVSDRMVDWLTNQDIPKLVERLTNLKETER